MDHALGANPNFPAEPRHRRRPRVFETVSGVSRRVISQAESDDVVFKARCGEWHFFPAGAAKDALYQVILLCLFETRFRRKGPKLRDEGLGHLRAEFRVFPYAFGIEFGQQILGEDSHE